MLLNLFSNGFHATQERLERGREPDYRPTMQVSSRRIDHAVEIRGALAIGLRLLLPVPGMSVSVSRRRR